MVTNPRTCWGEKEILTSTFFVALRLFTKFDDGLLGKNMCISNVSTYSFKVV